MSEEKEILTIINKEKYETIGERLKKEFSSSKSTKRLAIQCTDTSSDDLDTRIRISNKKVSLMQKGGKWKSKTREEIEIDLPNETDVVLRVFKILRNMLKGDKVRTSVIQTDSLTFENEDCEIKLTHQFGKTDRYNAEIEVFDTKLEPEEIAEEFNIPIHLPEHTAEFWDNWSKEVNFSADELSEEDFKKLIKKYL
ncbi:hypothetical protein COS54_01740 [Candidatus Shapirobacteria bacterium CG03_land_8_20_14_0_80_39_12]|uniref:CYTH domain-containing protein n=1 Tax=Candidatus Shapirobacteria bacterium CG03_land_8_20_14_0_80_39_12 TaxID=1974879 RepID=A0A2M7BD78_9BACT|nr:MAG: hypothetical protein COS54_01740 [Candidatus Shapirobacteria bacterium CG03_land_8_20_14_0_80_39_12]